MYLSGGGWLERSVSTRAVIITLWGPDTIPQRLHVWRMVTVTCQLWKKGSINLQLYIMPKYLLPLMDLQTRSWKN